MGSTIGTAAALSWTPGTAGTYVLRYTATNSIGSGTDDVQVTVTAVTAPTVNAGADVASHTVSTTFTRTATENANGSTITARAWTIFSGPAGVGTTIGTAAALSWTPTTIGTYVLRYSATNAIGTGTDDMSIVVAAVPGAPTGVTILPQNVNGKVAVEVAWGANLTADPATWTWTEITTDVRIEQGIKIKIGRSDEAGKAQPSSCKFTVDNSTGKYSLGGLSPNWPNVRKGTPLRVQMDVADGNGFKVIFQGNIDTFSPDWNTKGNVAEAEIHASGALRRLQQRTAPLKSPMRRFHETYPNLGAVGYWPAEEGSSGTVLKPAVGTQDMRVDINSNLPNMAAFGEFTTTYPIPTLNGSSWRAPISPVPAATGRIAVTALINIPASGGTDQTDLLNIWTNGQVELWALRYTVTGDLTIVGYSNGVLVVNTNVGFDLDGKFGQLQMVLTQDGADIDWRMTFLRHPAYSAGYFDGTLTGKTLGAPTQVEVNANGGNTRLSIVHV